MLLLQFLNPFYQMLNLFAQINELNLLKPLFIHLFEQPQSFMQKLLTIALTPFSKVA